MNNKNVKTPAVETVGNDTKVSSVKRDKSTADMVRTERENSGNDTCVIDTENGKKASGTDDTKTVIKKYDYGNGMYEIVKSTYSPEKRIEIGRFVHYGRDTCLDTFTDEYIEKNHPETKADCARSVQKGMLQKRRMLSYNINPVLKEGYCSFVTLTFSNPIDDLEEVSDRLKTFLKKIRRRYKSLKYCCFIEISYSNFIRGVNLYHIHCLFWFEQSKNERERYEFKNYIYNQWRNGSTSDYQEVTTSEDLNKVLFYVCNYSGSSEKSKQKRSTLKHFPAYFHLTKQSKGLKRPKGEEVADFEETSKPYSYSSPIASCGHLTLATYIEHENPDTPN